MGCVCLSDTWWIYIGRVKGSGKKGRGISVHDMYHNVLP